MAKTGVDLATYRLSIGVWVTAVGGGRIRRRSCFTSSRSPTLFFIVVYLAILLRADALPSHGDVERNPGPSSVRPEAADASRVGGLLSNSNLTSTACLQFA